MPMRQIAPNKTLPRTLDSLPIFAAAKTAPASGAAERWR